MDKIDTTEDPFFKPGILDYERCCTKYRLHVLGMEDSAGSDGFTQNDCSRKIIPFVE